MAFVSPQRLIFGALLVVLIVVAELVLARLELPAWPAFMVMIFFFVEHMDRQKMLPILVGACAGIACIVLGGVLIPALTPYLGQEAATLAFIVIVVYSIVALGEAVPVVFNNYAFMFLTVSALAVRGAEPNPYVWMGVAAVGGGLLLLGILGIQRLLVLGALRRAGGSPQVTGSA